MLISHFALNDHSYNYDISKMQIALIEDSSVLIEGGRYAGNGTNIIFNVAVQL